MPVPLPPWLSKYTIYSRSELLRDGYTDDRIQKALATNRVSALAPGFYLESTSDKPRQEETYLLSALARQAAAGSNWALSHVAAALVSGFANWKLSYLKVETVRQSDVRNTRSHGTYVKRWMPLGPEELSHRHGILVTSPARTVIDLACAVPFESALVAAESTLHRELVTEAELHTQLERQRGTRGIAKARKVVEFASTFSASPFESRSRVFFRRHGIPQPLQQFAVVDSSAGDVLAITDFRWEGTPVVGECDGMGKYFGDAYGDGVSNYRRDKRKRELLEELGFVVISWTWDELEHHPARLAARIGNALKPYGLRAA